MTTGENTTNPTVQDLQNQLAGLVAEAQEVNQSIDRINKEAEEVMNNAEQKINASIGTLEGIYADLDQIEKEAGDEFEALALQEAERSDTE